MATDQSLVFGSVEPWAAPITTDWITMTDKIASVENTFPIGFCIRASLNNLITILSKPALRLFSNPKEGFILPQRNRCILGVSAVYNSLFRIFTAAIIQTVQRKDLSGLKVVAGCKSLVVIYGRGSQLIIKFNNVILVTDEREQ